MGKIPVQTQQRGGADSPCGDFKVAFGKPGELSEKFDRFALFIEKGLNVVGWDRYSMISLKYDNQVVCTKR